MEITTVVGTCKHYYYCGGGGVMGGLQAGQEYGGNGAILLVRPLTMETRRYQKKV